MIKRTSSRKAAKKVKESFQILKSLGFPKQQLNERSALTLLALLNLKPEDHWKDSDNPLMGITPMMDFFAEYYGKKYKPNTRETVRRQTVHQFVQAALIVQNPDKPTRPTNSPKAAYQIESSALALLRKYGDANWSDLLSKYLGTVGSLKELYAREREIQQIPIELSEGKTINLSPGVHNRLVKSVLSDFCSRYTPGGEIIYVGDTKKKWAYLNAESLQKLGVEIEEHGKMPDVVIFYRTKNWLVLVEAVTSHGPVNPKRRNELSDLFTNSKAGIVYVTAFKDRHSMVKYLDEISWETEVWIAESPTHLIHFNGEKFLGPY